ncbi:isoaspartyl peptidase/L-asparaginase family protein [Pontibacter litorisediminis]|uniref:isoaspartyl peptidase/L-asparaginase family protein n=1 Tax=Pontibacter litorisediminis TaxID=1846260 RepID=UPI0023ECEC23|nr:isoaspartyl peptidase/L-asparaginase [Pontibacter litorisediminis]
MRKFAIAVHAGAETVKREEVSKAQEQAYRKGVKEAVSAGSAVLENGGSALDAVAAAITCMEENPLFNAGRGGSLNKLGETDFDAAIMDGSNLNSGSVGNVRLVRSPIRLALEVMKNCKHCFLVGTGAEEFALAQGLELVSPSFFVTEEKLKNWHDSVLEERCKSHDTVGAVALDQHGNLAAGTSTGGLMNRLKGRISDSPIIGGGTFAYSPYCAVSCTGDGEVIMRGAIAHEVYAQIKYANEALQAAADKAITMHKEFLKGDMGLVTLNQDATIAFAFNTNLMKRGYSIGGEDPVVALWDNEKV